VPVLGIGHFLVPGVVSFDIAHSADLRTVLIFIIEEERSRKQDNFSKIRNELLKLFWI